MDGRRATPPRDAAPPGDQAAIVTGRRGWADADRASTSGLTGLTQALAAEGKPHGVVRGF